MVQLDSRDTATVATTPPPPPPPASTRPPGSGRTFFDAFIAILAAVALIVGFYAFGKAIDDDGAGAVDASDAPPSDPGTETANASDDGEASDAAVAASDGHGGHDAAGEVDDRGFAALANGEQHGDAFTQAMTSEERTELGRQLTIAREVALQYPTLADAEAAGYWRAGPFSPGLGTHMISSNAGASLNGDGVMSDDDIRAPLALMYDGVEPTSRVAGLFYMSFSEGTPEGFAGPNDTWHVHNTICTVPREGGGLDTPLGADNETTKEQCDAIGGSFIEATQWLLHVWVVPGFESDQGVFAHLSSAVTCPDGTYNTIDTDKVGTRNTVCLDA